MISKMANIGCGPDVKEGWTNIDSTYVHPDVRLYDITEPDFAEYFKERFEFVLVNHVLCTMNYHMVHEALINIHRTLKPGGKLAVIDMDLSKVYQSYLDGRIDDIPIETGTLDEKLCYAISGYGTRLSLYTPVMMERVLRNAGFRLIEQLSESEYDTRPKESLIVQATK